MTVLYLVCLPAFLIVLAVAFATERNRYQPSAKEPQPHELAAAVWRVVYVRQIVKIFTGLLVAGSALAIWQATQGNTDPLQVLPIVLVLIGGTLWVTTRDARLRCAAIGITHPHSHFRDQAKGFFDDN